MLTILILMIICVVLSFSNYFDIKELQRDLDNERNYLYYLERLINMKGNNKNEKK